jgi:hypothetical protein
MRDTLARALNEAGLSRLTETVLPLARECILIGTTATDDDAIPVGSSKLGGSPDLPPGFTWPVWQNRPQAFIAQFRLSELPALEGEVRLPRDGLLSFFYDSAQSTWGSSPADAGSWSVLYDAGDPAALQRTAPPEAPSPPRSWWQRLLLPGAPQGTAKYRPCALAFHRGLSLPSWETLDDWRPFIEMTDAERDAYCDLLVSLPELFAGAPIPGHRLLGYADPIQGEMEGEVAAVTADAYQGHDAADASEWQLLLQVDSDGPAGMMWGDAGMIYYWIHRRDLAAARFDATWLVLQCH